MMKHEGASNARGLREGVPRAIIDKLDQVRCGLIGIFPSFLMNPQLASALQLDDLLP